MAEPAKKTKRVLSKEAKKRKRESDRTRGRSRINIGRAYTRWREHQEATGCKTVSGPAPGFVGSLVYDLQHKPESKRGYVLAGRTALRFLPPVKKYQQDWSRLTVCSPGKAPFNSSTPRFMDKLSMTDSSPGPGAYAHKTIQSKVSWPMKFSSTDWSRVPMLERKALRTELLSDRDFRKQQNRVAYLRLYY